MSMTLTSPSMHGAHVSSDGVITTHECAASGCRRQTRIEWLMCIDHWRMVPAPLRRDVWARYRRLGSTPVDANRERYLAAVQAAVDAVHTKALARKGRADAQTPPLF